MSVDVTILEQTVLVDIVDDETINVSLLGPSIAGQGAIQWDDEGVALGTVGTVNEVDFVGSGVAATRVGGKVTVTISAGGGGGTGDVTGPASAVADDIATFNGVTGKIIKDGSAKISDLQLRTEKDASAGYVGRTLMKINFPNDANNFTSLLKNLNTAARTYTFLDRDGQIMDSFIDRVIGSTLDRWHGASENGTANATAALTINVLRAHPFAIRFPMTIDRLGAEVTTGASGNVVLGIYNSGTDGKPDQLVVTTGALAIAGTGVKSATISTVLLPGIYWFTYLTDTANTFRCYTSVASLLTTLGFPNTIGATMANGWSVALTYTATLPQTFTAGGAVITVSVPCICIRIASTP